jgi:hypothetical protein
MLLFKAYVCMWIFRSCTAVLNTIQQQAVYPLLLLLNDKEEKEIN